VSVSLSMILRYGPDGASSRVRGFELARALEARGTRVDILAPGDPRWRRRYYAHALSRPALYLQKRVSARDLWLLRARHALGRTTLFDFDDAPGGVRNDPAQEALVAAMMHAARAVTVGGHALCDFASRHNADVTLIPSAVDTAVFAPAPRPRQDGVATVGWIGNGAGYAPELSDLARVVERVRQRTRVRVVVVGAVGEPAIHAAFRHEDDTVVDAVDWTSEAAIVSAMRAFDVGVYPLRDTRYNAFKCGYKAIQYMALALPVVASPTGENGRIVAHGETGFVAAGEDEWVESLCALALDAALGRRMGEAGRERAVSRYSLEAAAAALGDLVSRLA